MDQLGLAGEAEQAADLGRWLSRDQPRLGAAIVAEAAADLLAEISETTRLTTPASIIQLYERWLQTGSRRAATLLAEQGITPMKTSEGVQ